MKDATPAEKAALTKRWVDTWKFVTGPELERMKKKELRALTEEEASRRVSLVMDARTDDRWRRPERRESSGLIEQQRYFMRFRRVGT